MLYDSDDILATLEFFGTPGTFFKDTGDEVIVTGIFDYESEMFGDEYQLSGRTPLFICREADVTNVEQYTSVEINSVVYKIRDTQPDGTGVMVLRLKK